MGKRAKLKNASPETRRRMELTKTLHMSAKTVDIETCVKAYEELKRMHAKLDAGTFSVALHIACEKGSDEMVEGMIRDLRTSGVRLSEPLYTCLIKFRAAHGATKAAQDLFDELKSLGIVPKLRTYAPMVAARASAGDKIGAFELIREMRSTLPANIDPSEEIYRDLLRVCVRDNDADLFYATLHSMKEVVTEIDADTVDVIRRWFRSAAATDRGESWRFEEAVVDAKGRWRDVRMKLVHLTEAQRCEMVERVDSLACKGAKKTAQFRTFIRWLEDHGPFDVFIDTANVGLYCEGRPGFGHGTVFCPEQVENVRKAYADQGRRVLMVMHRKWMQRTPEAIARLWKGSSFVLEKGNNDDWYWLAAAARAGPNSLVITNDRMRDHNFAMLAPRNFVKFKQGHLVRYTFEYRKLSESATRQHPSEHRRSLPPFVPVPKLDEPPAYSRRVQTSERGWHFPLATSSKWLHVVLSCPSNIDDADGSSSKTTGSGETVLVLLERHLKERESAYLAAPKFHVCPEQIARIVARHVRVHERKMKRNVETLDAARDAALARALLSAVSADIARRFDGMSINLRRRLERGFAETLRWDLVKKCPLEESGAASVHNLRFVLACLKDSKGWWLHRTQQKKRKARGNEVRSKIKEAKKKGKRIQKP